MGPVRSLLIALCLAALPALALDECLGLRFSPTGPDVEKAWKAALAGAAHPEKGLTTKKGPCMPHPELGPAQRLEVVDCSPDNLTAVVSVGHCVGPLRDEPVICGAAMVDLEQKKVTAYLPWPVGPQGTLRFIGDALVKSGPAGDEVRYGPGFATVKLLPHARVVIAARDPKLLAVAVGPPGAEKLASYRLGAAGPLVLSGAAGQVERIDLIDGSPLVIATFSAAEGPSTVAVVDLQAGKTLYRVKGAFRYAVDPSGDRFFTANEEADAEGNYSLVHQVHTRDGKVERLKSVFGINGQIAVSPSVQNGRVAIGGPGAVELLTLGPLARGGVVRPFGDKATAIVHTLRWIDGRRLLAATGEYVPSTGRMNNQVAMIDAVDGKVLTTWRDAILSGATPLDVRVQQETRYFTIGADGGEVSAPAQFAYPAEHERTCDGLAEKLAPELFVQTNLGILLPRPQRP